MNKKLILSLCSLATFGFLTACDKAPSDNADTDSPTKAWKSPPPGPAQNADDYDSEGFHRITHVHQLTGDIYAPNGYDYLGFDKTKHDRQGFNIEGFHKDTKLHKETKYYYGPDGYDYQGHNIEGFHKLTRLHQDTKEIYGPRGYNAEGFLKDTNLHKDTGTHYGPEGYDYLGYNKAGFNAAHEYKDGGLYGPGGWDYQGYNADGFHKDTHLQRNGDALGPDGNDFQGYNAQGFHKDTHLQRNGDALGPDGNDFQGYNADGFHKDTHLQRNGDALGPDGNDYQGYNADGFHKDTHLQRNGDALGPDGNDYQGYNAQGFHKDTHLQRNGDALGPDGNDFQGYNADGFHKDTHLQRNGDALGPDGNDYQGFNADGFHKDTHLQRNGDALGPDGNDYQGYNAQGFHKDTHLQRNGDALGPDGNDYQGYNADGFHKDTHLQRNGDALGPDGNDYQGYNADGFHKDTHLQRNGDALGPDGNDYQGYNAQGFHKDTHLQRNGDALGPDGNDYQGYNADGFHKDTHLQRNGDALGPDGNDYQGYNAQGFHKDTHLQRNGDALGPDGNDYQGYNADGFHKDTHLQRNGDVLGPDGNDYQGYDADGFHKDTHMHRDGGLVDAGGYNYLGFDAANQHRNGGLFSPAGNDYRGFDVNGVDLLGLDTPDAKAYREQKIIEHLAQLRIYGLGLDDAIMLDPITDLTELKDAYRNLVPPDQPHPLIPSDKDLHNSLLKTRQKLEEWSAAGYRYNDIDQLKLVDAKVRKPGLYLDYEQLWQDAENAIVGPKDAFYMEIYNALNHDDLLGAADYPDPADAADNGNAPGKIQIKRNHLILALSSIKNRLDNQQLLAAQDGNPEIRSNALGFGTGGNSPLWFATQRLKLYRLSETIDTLNDDDKKMVVSQLLHAGRHCSDAKHDIYHTLMTMFNNPAFVQLELAEQALAHNLLERIEMVATRTKAVILQGLIDSTYIIITRDRRGDLVNNPGGPERADAVGFESFSYKAGTWDFYAPRLGLNLRNAAYPEMRFFLEENKLFEPGAYTPLKLFNEILRQVEVADEIVREIAGGLRPLIAPGSEQGNILIRGTLIEGGLLENL